MWKNMGPRAKFYCTVRNCKQIAQQFINSIGPQKDQVDSNTRQMEDLEKKLATQENNIRIDTGKEVKQAISKVNKALEKDKFKSEVKEDIETVLQSKNANVPGGGGAIENGQVKVEVQVVRRGKGLKYSEPRT